MSAQSIIPVVDESSGDEGGRRSYSVEFYRSELSDVPVDPELIGKQVFLDDNCYNGFGLVLRYKR